MDSPPHRVSIIVFPECDPSSIFGIFDTFWAAGRLWNNLHGLPPRPVFEPRLVGSKAGPINLVTSATIVTQDAIADLVDSEIVLIPNIIVEGGPGLRQLDRGLLAGIDRLFQRGSAVYASCSGALVLAEIGLLAGHEATTHWAYADLFRSEFPDVTLRPDCILVQSGPDQRIVTSGGASSWQDMVLFLVARHESVEESIRLSKVFLYQWHREGQRPYASMVHGISRDDPLVADLQAWIADQYQRPNLVAEIVERSRLSETTLKRRFKAATGYTPLAYVQTLRIEEAKHMLETIDMPVDAVAREVGYEDTAYFRKLFSRLTGMRPSDYRRKFRPPEMVVRASAPGRPRKTRSHRRNYAR